jgi:peptide/nickel transport system permease protein
MSEKSSQMAAASPAPITASKSSARALRRRWPMKLYVGLGIVGFFVLVAIVGPFLVSDASAISALSMGKPSGQHWLGTTDIGQDIFKQLVVGTRGEMEICFTAGILATALSLLIGVTGGYLGGKSDQSLAVVANVFLVLPTLPLIFLVADLVHPKSPYVIALIIGLTNWAASARVLRGQTLSLARRDYIDAARTSGESHFRIIVAEIIPNLTPIIAAQLVFALIGAILIHAGVAYLGLDNSTTVNWGIMLFFANNAASLLRGAWWWFIPPGLCIALFGAGLSLVNLGIDELLNPRLRVPTAKAAAKRAALARRAEADA